MNNFHPIVNDNGDWVRRCPSCGTISDFVDGKFKGPFPVGPGEDANLHCDVCGWIGPWSIFEEAFREVSDN